MRIRIISEGRRINLTLPNGLLYLLAPVFINRSQSIPMDAQQCRILLKSFRKHRDILKGRSLLEAETGDGKNKVTIKA